MRSESAATVAIVMGSLVLVGWCLGRAQGRPSEPEVVVQPLPNKRTFQGAVLFRTPMPPDLLNATPGCNLQEYGASNSIDAKTGETIEITRWLVEPFANYPDHRPKWELPSEPLPTNANVRHPGAIADTATDFEAFQACSMWRKAVTQAQAELRKQMPQKADPERRKDLGVPGQFN